MRISNPTVLSSGALFAATLILLTAVCAPDCASVGVHAAAARAADKPQKPTAAKPVSLPSGLTPDEKVNISVYEECYKAVVNIAPLATAEEMYFGHEQEGVGSGVVISVEGHVVTNHHVTGNADAVKVTFFDGTFLPAKVIGLDPSNDIAVLKILGDGKRKFDFAEWGNSANLQVGRRVFAIGDPFGFDHTMTSGIVSSLNRQITTPNRRLIKGIIQTDAAINPGNSGGPLLDTSGKIVGITTAIKSLTGQSAGIGLAIPANIVKSIVPELIAHGLIKRPEIGITYLHPVALRTSNGYVAGLQVIQIDPKGPAAEAGLRTPRVVRYNVGNMIFNQTDRNLADIITQVDSLDVKALDDLLSYIEKKEPGQVVKLTVVRNEGEKGLRILKIPVKLAVTRTD